MPLIELLNAKIDAKHLLKHPFYLAWANGELTVADLRLYAAQYFAHVWAFPAYLSEMHCRCEDLDVRRIIARNLAEEEGGGVTHPDLWLDFAAGLGLDNNSVLSAAPGKRVRDLVEIFRYVARMDTGLAAVGLYCYEKQVPLVAASKIVGLKEYYGITDETTLRYFTVHEIADVLHATEWEAIIDRTAPTEADSLGVADGVLDALWGALDEIFAECKSAPAAWTN